MRDSGFYKFGRIVGSKFKTAKWVWESAAGSEEEANRAEYAVGRNLAELVRNEVPAVTDGNDQLFLDGISDRMGAVVRNKLHRFEVATLAKGQPSAFALPGGKVAIFTGILKHTKHEDGLATVMAHEIAHALQRHGAERMSRGILEQIAQVAAIGGAASGTVDPQLAMGAMSAYGVGISLPHNRRQESEADYIGLQLMAKAGYNPQEAIGFWERMSGCPKQMIGRFCFRSNAAVPEFLSTHPSDVTRIKQIEAWIKDAMQYYQPQKEDKSKATKGFAKP